jgi:hypothetical protein
MNGEYVRMTLPARMLTPEDTGADLILIDGKPTPWPMTVVVALLRKRGDARVTIGWYVGQ